MQHQVTANQPRAVSKAFREAFIRGALQQCRREKSVRRQDEDARTQGDLSTAEFTDHPFDHPVYLLESDGAAVRKDLGTILFERRIETYSRGIIAAGMRAKHAGAPGTA